MHHHNSSHHYFFTATETYQQKFDKKFYDEIVDSVWWPRASIMGNPTQDWVTLRDNGFVEGLMLNTDICLAWDIEDPIDKETPYCAKINDECIEPESK